MGDINLEDDDCDYYDDDDCDYDDDDDDDDDYDYDDDDDDDDKPQEVVQYYDITTSFSSWEL